MRIELTLNFSTFHPRAGGAEAAAASESVPRADRRAPLRLAPNFSVHPMPSASHDPALLAARDSAVVCDLSPLAVLAVTGLDAGTFLQGQLSSDVDGLAVEACQYTSYNSPSGRMLANFVLWRAGTGPADGFRALARRGHRAGREKAPGDVRAALEGVAVGPLAGLRAVRCRRPAPPPWPFAPRSARRPRSSASSAVTKRDILGLPGPRFVVVTPAAVASDIAAALAPHARRGRIRRVAVADDSRRRAA